MVDTFLQYLILNDILICLERSWTMFGLSFRFWINGSEITFLTSKNTGWIINFLFFNIIPTNNLLVFCLLKRTQFLKFNSSIIKDFNYSWSTKSSHSRAAIFTFLFIYSKRISYLLFFISGGFSCCFDEDVHPFTYSFMLSTRLLPLHLRIPISFSLILLSFVYSFTVSTWIFLLHLGILISSSSLPFPFTYWFVFSTFIFILPLRIPISSS